MFSQSFVCVWVCSFVALDDFTLVNERMILLCATDEGVSFFIFLLKKKGRHPFTMCRPFSSFGKSSGRNRRCFGC
jgi:hypothetical protein